jgi:hypothetical protein
MRAVHAKLTRRGLCCGRKRVARLMRAHQQVGVHVRRRWRLHGLKLLLASIWCAATSAAPPWSGYRVRFRPAQPTGAGCGWRGSGSSGCG